MIVFILGIGVIYFSKIEFSSDKKKIEIEDYSGYYNEIVITDDDSEIYEYVNNDYSKIGIVHKNTKLLLEELSDKTNEYFKIKDLNGEY